MNGFARSLRHLSQYPLSLIFRILNCCKKPCQTGASIWMTSSHALRPGISFPHQRHAPCTVVGSGTGPIWSLHYVASGRRPAQKDAQSGRSHMARNDFGRFNRHRFLISTCLRWIHHFLLIFFLYQSTVYFLWTSQAMLC